MLQVARLAPNLLQEAGEHVTDFLRSRLGEEGGGVDRAGKSDLYYTVFCLEGLLALRAEPPWEKVEAYLADFGDGEGLDLVHLCCLARCRAALKGRMLDATSRGIARRIGEHRSADGGFAAKPGQEKGSVYHGFLAHGAHQDLGIDLERGDDLAASVEGAAAPGGGYGTGPGAMAATTPTTAAAVTLLRQLGRPAGDEVARYLFSRVHPGGGFTAGPGAPLPDLLSTATALHALA
jgi:hypothetical protein